MLRQLRPRGDECRKVGVSERCDDMLDDMSLFLGQAPVAESHLQKRRLRQFVKKPAIRLRI